MSSGSIRDRLRLDHTSGIPIHVQLRTQLEYAIATGAIPPGERLPAVRAMASGMGIAVDTVRQAYEELERAGLVQTRHGVGTQVVHPPESVGGGMPESRQNTLVDSALIDLLRGGVRPDILSGLVRQRLAMLHTGLQVGFVGVQTSVDRYAGLLSDELPSGLRSVEAIALDEFRQLPADGLAHITHMVSLLFHVKQVENYLAERPIRVLPLMSELEPAVLEKIGALTEADNAVLIARSTTRPIYEGLIQTRYPDLSIAAFASEEDKWEVHRLCMKASVILHTSASAALVNEVAQSGATRIELRHSPTADSLRNVVNSIRADWQLVVRLREAAV